MAGPSRPGPPPNSKGARLKANKETLTEEERSQFEVYLKYTEFDEEDILAWIEVNRRKVRYEKMLLERALPAAIHGLKFIKGPKRPRLDALGRLILDTMRDLEGELRRRPKAKEIWASLPKGDVVQELEGYDTVWWRSNGREKETTFRSFENRVTKIRKQFLS
jgi:hypothetical protein